MNSPEQSEDLAWLRGYATAPGDSPYVSVDRKRLAEIAERYRSLLCLIEHRLAQASLQRGEG